MNNKNKSLKILIIGEFTFTLVDADALIKKISRKFSFKYPLTFYGHPVHDCLGFLHINYQCVILDLTKAFECVLVQDFEV